MVRPQGDRLGIHACRVTGPAHGPEGPNPREERPADALGTGGMARRLCGGTSDPVGNGRCGQGWIPKAEEAIDVVRSADTRPAGGGRLILLRHAESEFNAANRFTGWADPPLTSLGEREAVRAGSVIAAAGCRPDAAFTSVLQRAVMTTHLVLAAADCAQVPVYRTWRLNGRHYGALQGKDKALIQSEFGAEQVHRWRRSYDGRPPPLLDDPSLRDPRYAALPLRMLPHAESLRDVTARLLPYWSEAIVPELCAGRTVLVVSHGNTLRALIKQLDGIADDEIARLEVPTARPLLYRLDAGTRPLVAGGSFLDGDLHVESEDADVQTLATGN